MSPPRSIRSPPRLRLAYNSTGGFAAAAGAPPFERLREIGAISTTLPPIPSAADEQARAIRALVAENALFSRFDDRQIAELLQVIRETRALAPGEILVREGDPATDIFVVKSGSFEVVKREQGSATEHRLATLGQGMSIGEVSLLDDGPRSATVRALEASAVLVIPIEEIGKLSRREQSLDVQMKINMAFEMSRRLRKTNETTVRTLRDKLEEAETRAEMGRFMSRVLIGTCLYMFALSTLKAAADYLPDTTPISLLVLLAFAGALFLNIKTSRFPVANYGFTTRNWRPAVAESLLFSVPWIALVTAMKLILIEVHPALDGANVFDFYRSQSSAWPQMLAAMTAYSLFAPVQEMIARSGIQSSFMMFLQTRHKVPLAIFMSTLLFSSTHLHLSLTFAMLVFPVGLFWGWLYSRHPTLIGVSVSHVLIGIYAVFVVGFPT